MGVASVPVRLMALALFTRMSMPPNFATVSATATVGVFAVLSVTLKVPTPLVSVLLPGRTASASVLVKVAVPL